MTGLDYALLVGHGDVHAARVRCAGRCCASPPTGAGPSTRTLPIITPEEVRKVHTRIDVRRLDLVNGNLYSPLPQPHEPGGGHADHQPLRGHAAQPQQRARGARPWPRP